MKLYQVEFEETTYYVEAMGVCDAVRVWRSACELENEPVDELDEPDKVILIHDAGPDEPAVLRSKE